jgi:hypothetical protein
VPVGEPTYFEWTGARKIVMSQHYTQCPKCGHKLPQAQPADSSCPACGIFFFKWVPPRQTMRATEEDLPVEAQEGWLAALFQPLDKIDVVSFYGRCAALAALGIWSWFLFRYDYHNGEISMSFMHNILLPIHEAGHVFFRVFGEFMMILGGSLFQLLLPFSIGVAFIVTRRDNFAAAICFWWASVSLVDLSPYIYDSLHPQLTLVGGGNGAEDGPHDWIYLLNRLNQLERSQIFGALAHFMGGVLMLAALLWALFILLLQRDQLGDTAE